MSMFIKFKFLILNFSIIYLRNYEYFKQKQNDLKIYQAQLKSLMENIEQVLSLNFIPIHYIFFSFYS